MDPLAREIQAAIEQYLNAEFHGKLVQHASAAGSLKYRVEANGCEYGVEFSREFLDEHATGDIHQLLSRLDVAGEMRRMEGMDLSVSSAGVRLDSSN